MGIGIQIKKPDHVIHPSLGPGSMPHTGEPLHWFFYALLSLTFPAALVALFFFLQTRGV